MSNIFSRNNQDDVLFAHELINKYFNYMNAPYRRLDYTSDTAYTIAPIFYFEKNSKLRVRLNHYLRLYDQSGLINYWIRQYTNDEKIKQKYKQEKLHKLQFKSINALLVICACICLLSIVIFMLEFFTLRFNYLNRFVDFFTY